MILNKPSGNIFKPFFFQFLVSL
uniref:Uncharacterized protein n=1 Tax=Arundo donax TaxID=35708 RepID=A0A0A9CJZ2_ARUDO